MPDTTAIEREVAVLTEKVKDIDHTLFGNGQPGKISQLETKIDNMKEEIHKLRTSVLLIVATSGAGIGSIITALLG